MADAQKSLKASAGFPEGWARSGGGYSSIAEVNATLKGKRIAAVEFPNENTVRFVLDDGVSVSMTPSGIDGDDITLSIEPTAEPLQ